MRTWAQLKTCAQLTATGTVSASLSVCTGRQCELTLPFAFCKRIVRVRSLGNGAKRAKAHTPIVVRTHAKIQNASMLRVASYSQQAWLVKRCSDTLQVKGMLQPLLRGMKLDDYSQQPCDVAKQARHVPLSLGRAVVCVALD